MKLKSFGQLRKMILNYKQVICAPLGIGSRVKSIAAADIYLLAKEGVKYSRGLSIRWSGGHKKIRHVRCLMYLAEESVFLCAAT